MPPQADSEVQKVSQTVRESNMVSEETTQEVGSD